MKDDQRRLTVDVPVKCWRQLKGRGVEEGRTVAEIVRELVERYLEQVDRPPRASGSKASGRARETKEPDAVAPPKASSGRIVSTGDPVQDFAQQPPVDGKMPSLDNGHPDWCECAVTCGPKKKAWRLRWQTEW